jgi:putative methionine-R-sulfoxide reductase with GAF domain
VNAGGDSSNGNRLLGEQELDSALQLLVERAQYITGATGSALALPQGEEMVCRASAGASAPAVGARLQVQSGLTGESIARRQLLRCDNAESDPRVNLETCRALGIASIVVLPLLRRSGEVRGLFELFSDHPYAFEERDLIALERMADLTSTALDLAEQRNHNVPAPTASQQTISQGTMEVVESPLPATVIPPRPFDPKPEHIKPDNPELNSLQPAGPKLEITEPIISEPAIAEPAIVQPIVVQPAITGTAEVFAAPAPIPEAMLRVQKCAFCGFPVSEGRTLCLDCEKKDSMAKQRQKDESQSQQQKPQQQKMSIESAPDTPVGSTATAVIPVPAAAALKDESQEEFVPAFLANATPVSESWLANHVNLLAIVVFILGVLVAFVVFR